MSLLFDTCHLDPCITTGFNHSLAVLLLRTHHRTTLPFLDEYASALDGWVMIPPTDAEGWEGHGEATHQQVGYLSCGTQGM